MQNSESIDVQYVAQLARLTLTVEEAQLFQSQLQNVLSYVEELNTLDVKDVEPTAHAIPRFNVFREDTIKDSFPSEVALQNAPQKNNDLVVVPKIIEQNV
ncbi:MAG: Asp-tRNA(Asn)/Glu-tRNA(Gln) amidotransferase subunit GatC [Verrucomicrobiae bacterium]|nr:Asp-tRNA(Asn)/Glu-tRNA(Gln) amidotransferase subunit GatC [Verrucomicrobiae bacterium]